jgi:tetratricopeptide (TPR) repeat protein
MRRQLNVRLFLWLLGALLAVSLAVHIVHAVQLQRNAGALLRRADHALQTGDLAGAVTYLSHYLTYQPTDTDALAKYGIVLDKHSPTGAARIQAMLTMEEVLRREPHRAEVRYRLVQCLIALGKDWLPQAIENLNVLLPVWPDRAEIEHTLGWCCEAAEDYPRAAAWFRKAVTDDPRRISSHVLLAEILQGKLAQRDEAGAVMDAMVAGNAKSYQAYLARGRFHKQRGELAKTEADIRRALDLDPKNDEVILASADWAQAKGNVEEAHRIVQQGLVLYPDSEPMYHALAELELRLGRRTSAIEALRRGVEALPRSVELLVFLGDLLIDDGDTVAAAELNRRLRQDDPAQPLADYLEARLAIAARKWSEATPLLERARADLPPTSPWNSHVEAALGVCFGQAGDVDRELAAYERAVELAPDWTGGRLGLAAALLAARRGDDALNQLRQIPQSAAPPKVYWPLLVRTLLQRNLRLPPGERAWPAVEEALAGAARAAPDSPEVNVLRAEVLAAKKSFAEAAALLRAARDRKPDQIALWIGLANLEAQQGHWDKAVHVLAEAVRLAGDRVELRLAGIAVWMARGGEGARPALTALGKNFASFGPTEQVRLLRALGNAWYRVGDLQAAATFWDELARREPHDVPNRLNLFEIALQQGRAAEAVRLADSIRRLDGDAGALTNYAQAALLVQEARSGDQAKAREADRLLSEVAGRRRDWPRVPLLQAKSAELQGQIDRAIDAYLRALNLGDGQPALVQRLVRLLSSRRRYLEADQVLQKMEELAPLDKDLRCLAAEAALAVRELPRAVRLAEEAVPPATRDYRELLWLARVYYLAGANAAAEKTLRRALQHAGHTPQTWIALVRHLASADQRSAVRKVLEDMKQKLPADRLELTLALCEEALGHVALADKRFARLVNDRQHDFPVLYHAASFYSHADLPDRAEPCLRALLDPALGAPSEEAAWARRALAVIVAPRGGSAEANKLLTENTGLFGKSVADDRARAIVLGSQKEQLRQAVMAFEATLPRRPLDADEQFALVKLYDSAGEPAKARDWLQDLLAAHPDNAQYLAYFVRSLLKQGQAGDAAPHLRRLEHIEPHSARTRELKKESARTGT